MEPRITTTFSKPSCKNLYVRAPFSLTLDLNKKNKIYRKVRDLSEISKGGGGGGGNFKFGFRNEVTHPFNGSEIC